MDKNRFGQVLLLSTLPTYPKSLDIFELKFVLTYIFLQRRKKSSLVPQAASLSGGFLKGKSKEFRFYNVFFAKGSASTLAVLAESFTKNTL